MTIRSDAAKCVKKQKLANQVRCTMKLELTDEHWNEAKANAKDPESKESQREYIRAEAASGCDEGCGCDGGASPAMPDDSVVTAVCAQDPSSMQGNKNVI